MYLKTAYCIYPFPHINIEIGYARAGQDVSYEAEAAAMAGSDWFVREIMNRRQVVKRPRSPLWERW